MVAFGGRLQLLNSLVQVGDVLAGTPSAMPTAAGGSGGPCSPAETFSPACMAMPSSMVICSLMVMVFIP